MSDEPIKVGEIAVAATKVRLRADDLEIEARNTRVPQGASGSGREGLGVFGTVMISLGTMFFVVLVVGLFGLPQVKDLAVKRPVAPPPSHEVTPPSVKTEWSLVPDTTSGLRPSSERVIERVVSPEDMLERTMTCSDTAKACWTEE